MSQKRTFTTFTRMPYQDSISLVLKMIDYHNNQAMKDFSNAEFHKKQAMVLKMYLIDIKEFIIKHENECT
tara:strand:- start:184 stop:393 length:210 start_codon:yes stop_codon:yes gene_type:complete